MFVIEKYSIYFLCSLPTFSISLGKAKNLSWPNREIQHFFHKFTQLSVYTHREIQHFSHYSLDQDFQQTKPKLLHCYMHLARDMLHLLLHIIELLVWKLNVFQIYLSLRIKTGFYCIEIQYFCKCSFSDIQYFFRTGRESQ